jgi:hypothetical protein
MAKRQHSSVDQDLIEAQRSALSYLQNQNAALAELPPVASADGRQIREYALLTTLGKGASCKVKLGQHKKDATHAALKLIYIDDDIMTPVCEVDALQTLAAEDHPHILVLKEVYENELYTKKKLHPHQTQRKQVKVSA